jgi:hypothetical protein
MASTGEQPEIIFCLFHQQIDCPCLKPVIDQKNLRIRLEESISLNNLLNKHSRIKTAIAERLEQNEAFQKRLNNL